MDLGKAVGILLRMVEMLRGTAEVLVQDSAFFVLKGIIKLRNKGVFSTALIKTATTGQGKFMGIEPRRTLKTRNLGMWIISK